MDNGDGEPALICPFYTWNDDALKWLPLDAEEQMRLMLHSLAQIYPGVDIASHIVGDPITVSWEEDPNFMGAFSDNLPGHYRHQERLYTHFMQEQENPPSVVSTFPATAYPGRAAGPTAPSPPA